MKTFPKLFLEAGTFMVFALCCFLLGSVTANAEFGNCPDNAEWLNYSNTGGYVNFISTDFLELGSDGDNTTSLICFVATADIILDFDWTWENHDFVGPYFDPFGYINNGNYTQLSNFNSGQSYQTGSESVAILSGQTFCLYLFTDFCCGGAYSTVTLTGCSVPAPENDLCADATTISNNSEVCGTTVGASEDLPNNGDDCVDDADAQGQGVWYTFVGNGSIWEFYFEARPGWDPEINLYSGSCGTFTCVTGNDDNGQGYGGLDASISVTTLPGVNYYLYVHDCCGGVNTFCYTVSTVQTLCNLGATLNGTSEVCSGGYINLVATGGNQYQWSGPNGYTNTGGSITRYGATPSMSGTYTVTITNNDCVDVLSTEVVVYATPSATITGNTPVCSGGTISLSAPAGYSSYAWSGPGGYTANTSTATRSAATTAMSGLYKVTVTGGGGCTASASKSVTVSVPGSASVSGASSFCAGSTITLSASGGASYAWSGPGGYTQSGATLSRSGATSAMAGTYTVTVTSTTGCISVGSKTISVSAAPTPAIANYSVCGNRIYLIASGGNSYSWSGPGYSGSSTIVLVRPPVYGTYTVTVSNSSGCTASASVTIDCGGGGKNAGDITLSSLTAFPNPSSGNSTISFIGNAAEQVRLSVHSIDGRQVAELFNEQTEADMTYQLNFDTSNLPEGIYYAILTRAGGTTERLPVMVVK